MPLDPNVVHYGQFVLIGSHDFTPHHFTPALKLLAYRIVDLQTLVSNGFPLERAADAQDLAASRQGLKAMVRMS